MSNGSRANERLDVPHTNIGAQELLRVGTNHSGFLRKKGKLERIVTSNGLLSAIFSEIAKWRQRFVILSRGCLYVFPDEQATRPQYSVSLRGYVSVKRHEPDEVSNRSRRSFEVIPSNEHHKTLIFGCAKDGERKVWMQKVREELLVAHDRIDSRTTASQLEDYDVLEVPLKRNDVSSTDMRQFKPLPEHPAEEDPYDRIAEPSASSPRPLPEIPNENEAPRTSKQRPIPAKKPREIPNDEEPLRASKQKPIPAKKPKLKKQMSSVDEYIFKSSDRSKAVEILSEKPEGTFLVRDGRTDDSKVLSVQTDEGVKEYKIFTDTNNVSLDKVKQFKDIDELLGYYKAEHLPRRTTCLSRGYSCTENDKH